VHVELSRHSHDAVRVARDSLIYLRKISQENGPPAARA
jgi:hypothetical protein